MTSLQRDPRKQYVLDKRNCKDLSITQKLYHPECRKEASAEKAINPKPTPTPKPKPKPKPKPTPNVPDLPPEPAIPYSFTVPNYQYNYRQGQSYNPIITGATTGGLAGVMTGEAIRYTRASPPNGYSRVATEDPDIEMGDEGEARPPARGGRYTRVPTDDPNRPSARGLTEGDVDRPRFTVGQRGSYYARRLRTGARITPRDLPADEGFTVAEEDRFERPQRFTVPRPNVRSRISDIQVRRYRQFAEGMRTEMDTPSSSGLRFRGRGLGDEITFTNPEEEGLELPSLRDIPLDTPAPSRPLITSRIPFISQMPRANPPKLPAPSSSTRMLSQSEAELSQSRASASQLTDDLDSLITQSKAEQSSIGQAEAKLSTAESMEAGGVTANVEQANIASIRTQDIQAQEGTELAEAEGDTTADAGIDTTPDTNVDLSPEDTVDTAVAEGAESGILSALKDPKNYSRPIALLGGLAVGAGVGAGVGAISNAIVNSADKGTNENIAEQAQRQANNDKIGSIITNQITNPMEYSPYAVAGNIVQGIFVGNRKAQTFAGLSNTGVMTSEDITNTLSSVNDELKKADKGTEKYSQLSALSSALTQASTSQYGGFGKVISYTNSQGNSEIAFPLTSSQIATAIKVYQQNPNAFKGVDTTKLQIMGLNPAMSLGLTGATKTSIGYIPTKRIDGASWTSGAGGGNWSDFYLGKSTVGSKMFNSNSDINTLAVPDSQQETILNDNYISQVDTIINAQTNPQVKAYLQYELDTFKYKIGYLPTPPKPVPKPEATPAMSEELTELSDNLAREKGDLADLQTSISNQQSLINTANTKISDITQSISTEKAQQQSQQLQSYQTQVNAYNQQVAQNIDVAEGQTASYNIAYARATNTPLNAPVGRYLTNTQIQSFQSQLASGQIKTTGVSPITTLSPTGISTSASGSPVVNQNALKTVPAN